jgi:DNA-binding phage protein
VAHPIKDKVTSQDEPVKLHKSSKGVHRMLGPDGNPRMDSIVSILKVLQDQERIRLHM